MGFQHIRIGHPAAHNLHPTTSKRDACSSGGFITGPSMGTTLNFPGTSSMNITWTPSCLSASELDIYLYAFPPASSGSTASTRIHLYTGVPNAPGSYSAPIKPKWWNSTSTVSLQLLALQKGDAPFLASLPAGPVFTATYTAPSSGNPVPADADTSKPDTDGGVTSFAATTSAVSHHGLSPGKKAAAAILPLLFIIILGVAYYLRMSRLRGKEQRRVFSEKVDKRMSTISTDWKSMSAAGANAAIRSSMAIPRASTSIDPNNPNRASAFSFGAIRPPSTFDADGGQAGLAQYQSHLRPGMLAPGGTGRLSTTERVSRVSFATDTRPSVDRMSRSMGTGTGRASRAFHSAFTLDVPPVPSAAPPKPDTSIAKPAGILKVNTNTGTRRSEDSDSNSNSESAMSPTQKVGALDLSAEEIKARIGGTGSKTDEDDAKDGGVLPALSLMRTGKSDKEKEAFAASTDDLLFSPSQFTSSPSPTSGGQYVTYPVPPTPSPAYYPRSPAPAYEAESYAYGGMSVPSPAATTLGNAGAYVTPMSPVYSMNSPMPSMTALTGAPAMSPDALLRAYAERRAGARMTQGSSPPIRSPPPATPGTPRTPGSAMPLLSTNASGAVPMTRETVYVDNRAGLGAGRADAETRQSASLYSVGEDD